MFNAETIGAEVKLIHYGLQRSGTNYLAALLRKRYRVHFLNNYKDLSSPVHKHFRLYDKKEIIPVPQYKNELRLAGFAEFEGVLNTILDYYVVISKDPYSWYLSYQEWAKKCGWPSVKHHYISEYNAFYGKWIEFSRQTNKIGFVRYIDLIENEKKELSRLEAVMGLKKRAFYRFLKKKITQLPHSEKFTSDRRDYYINYEYMNKYTKNSLSEMNRLIDDNVTSELGYEVQGNV